MLESRRTFFVTTKTSMGRSLFQVERHAQLLVEVLRSCVGAGRFEVHDFVVMPDHVHLLITVGEGVTIERAMQWIKGGFSYRIKREAGYLGEVWQKGFSEVRVNDRTSYLRHREYIAQNPVRAGLVNAAETFAWCYESLRRKKAAAAEAGVGLGRGTV